MNLLILLRAGLILLGIGLVAFEIRSSRLAPVAFWGLIALAVINLLLVTYLVINQLNFPLHLEVMEGNILQHFERAADFKPIYPDPSPAYVSLIYNPLYYVLAVPFSWIFGVNLFTLRLVASLGMLGCGVMIYIATKEQTQSWQWGLIAAGLFAAAYRAMDAYLNSAHSDSWMLFAALLGTYVISRRRSRAWNTLGVLLLIASFWFKQQGALFAAGGLLYLTWREGIRQSIPYWLTAALLGPILYVLGGPAIFGPRFLYFTWEIPGQWPEVSVETLFRFVKAIVRSYFLLAGAGGLFVLWLALKDRDRLNIWHIQFIPACLAGLSGALNTGSSDNAFVPMGIFFILVGTIAFDYANKTIPQVRRYRLPLLALFISFAVFLYDPRPYIVSPDADKAYDDFITMLDQLDGPVYAPWQSHLDDFEFSPTPGWVALEDMIRGPGIDTRNHPNTRKLLAPAIAPEGPAYILTNYPLRGWPWIAFLLDYYVLEADFGDRFEALRAVPHHWDTGYPRYLYRYDPEKAQKPKDQ